MPLTKLPTSRAPRASSRVLAVMLALGATCLGVSPTGFGVSPVGAQPAPPPAAPTAPRETRITLEELWQQYRYTAKRVPGFNFRKRGNFYSRIDENAVVEVDLATDAVTDTLFDYAAARAANAAAGLPERFDGYAFSEDQRRLLVSTGLERIYRRSSRADFYAYDAVTGAVTPIDADGPQMYATFSPDGRRVAYVRERDLYVLDLASGQRTRLTDDGAANRVVNGATDWVYEEEFALAQAFAWSPDGQSILYLRFDETAVPEFTMPMYPDDALYPEYVTWKYPKVGEANATVQARVVDVPSGKTRTVFDTGDGDTHIPRIYWTPAGEPVVWVTNRRQNDHRLLVERSPGAALETLVREQRDTYYDVHDDLRFLADGSFLWASDRDGYNHLYHYGPDGRLIRQLTRGNYPVTSFYGYDAAREVLYFQAAMRSPLRREVYRLPLGGGRPEAIAAEPGWNGATFNGDFSGYLLSHSTINTPPTYAVYDAATGRQVRALEDNAGLRETMREEGVRPTEFWSFTTPAGDELNGWRITPEGFSESGGAAYPVFMFQYSGPASQQVVDAWRGSNWWWFQMLAQQGYVVVCVDGRGTGGRGAAFAKQTYLELGKLEVADQISAAKHLAAQPWVDGDRIGIFGWSYGGYMSTLAILKGADVFSLAIAVAPVTNWKWYDTLYTERYMRTLADNPDGYRDNSPVHFAELLEGDYLLVHGMGDDNVHFQHAVEMADALIAANKDFEFYAYPNRNHGIYGGVTRYHLYDRMTEFVNERL